MGILVPEATLPSQITLSNVYMSFTGENILVINNRNDSWRISSYYNVFSDKSKTNGTNIRIPIEVNTVDITQGVYIILYNQLKLNYPGSIDVLYTENKWPLSENVPDKMTDEEYQFGIETLSLAETYMVTHPEIREFYDAAETNFGVNGPASEQMFALKNAIQNL